MESAAILDLTSNNKEEINRARAFTLASLPEECQQGFRHSIEYLAKHSAEISTPLFLISRYLFEGGFLQAVFFNGQRPFFSFGAEILTVDGILYTREIPQMLQIHRMEGGPKGTWQAIALSPASLGSLPRSIFEDRIMPVLQETLIRMPSLQYNDYSDLFVDFEESIRDAINTILDSTGICHVAHLHFQDFSSYFDILGEHRSLAILDNLDTMLKNNIKADDRIIRLSPQDILILFQSTDSESIKRRFRSIYFEIDSLVFDYDLNIIPIKKKPVQMGELWQDLRIY